MVLTLHVADPGTMSGTEFGVLSTVSGAIPESDIVTQKKNKRDLELCSR